MYIKIHGGLDRIGKRHVEATKVEEKKNIYN